MLAYVLAVDLAAAALVVLTTVSSTITPTDLVRFGLLSAAAVVHLEAARSIERLREVAAVGVPYVNLKSLWVFTAVILLPLPLVFVLVLISYLYAWARVDGRTMACKKTFSAATFVLASGGSAAVLGVTGLVERPGIPGGPLGALVLVTAGAAWWLVNFALVVGAFVLNDPTAPARKALGDLADQLIVAAALGLGIGMAALVVYSPWLVAILMVTVLALHRGFLVPLFQRQAQTDGKTGLMQAVFFTQMGAALLERLRQQGRSAALLMIDLDRFKEVNDTLGHKAGDELLAVAAGVLRAELREGDLVARYGGDEFVVLLPEAGVQDVDEIGARILQALRGLQLTLTTPAGPAAVDGLSASVGASLFPLHGDTVDALLLAADAALLRAKDQGRARLLVAPRPAGGDVPVPRAS